MKVYDRSRRWLGRQVLRGRVGELWIQRKTKRLERRFCRELAVSSGKPISPAVTLAFKRGEPLRQILLIADIMWEANDLVPELANICPTVAFDLHPHLRKNAGRVPEPQVMVLAVRGFMEEQKALEPDVILFYARPGLLSEEVFDLLRRRWSCPLFGMNLDDKFQFLDYGIFRGGDDNYQRWAQLFDLNITNGIAASEWYQQRGLPCIYSPQGVHRPKGLTMPLSADFKYELSFLGGCKPERKMLIRQIEEMGIAVALFGSGWPNSQWVDDPNAIFQTSQLNLGIGFASPSFTLTTTKGRDFECPGVGACYLTTYNWELTKHYELGKEILCYRSVEELAEMYNYYRKRPVDCLKIAQAAWRRCGNEHTWEKRFRRIFRQVGLLP